MADEFAYVVIYSTGKEKEWPNRLEEETGEFIYYGDNRSPGNHYLHTKQKGNVFLESIFEKAYGSSQTRQTIPPMFVFQHTGNRLNVEFLGIAVYITFDKTGKIIDLRVTERKE